MFRTICAVTGSRADWGLLRPVLEAIREEPRLILQLVVTGSHLDLSQGNTQDSIPADGFEIDARVDIDLGVDTVVGVTRSLGRGVMAFADQLSILKPDLLLVLGDRYEILAAVQAALIARIPVAHIAGGDVTEGAYDDAIRHSITKMSHLHFVTNQAAYQRVLQLGEPEHRVFLTGSPGIDQLKNTPLLTRAELASALDFQFQERNLAVTFHPATLDEEDAVDQVDQLLAAIDQLGEDTGVIFTGSNADTRGDSVNARIADYAVEHERSKWFFSLGQQRYYSLVAQADAVVGNSSSGLYEAPSLGTPTVNIGSRQDGRLKADSVIDCPPRADMIRKAIETAYHLDASNVVNPYGNGRATEQIIQILTDDWDRFELIRKSFVDRGCA